MRISVQALIYPSGLSHASCFSRASPPYPNAARDAALSPGGEHFAGRARFSARALNPWMWRREISL